LFVLAGSTPGMILCITTDSCFRLSNDRACIRQDAIHTAAYRLSGSTSCIHAGSTPTMILCITTDSCFRLSNDRACIQQDSIRLAAFRLSGSTPFIHTGSTPTDTIYIRFLSRPTSDARVCIRQDAIHTAAYRLSGLTHNIAGVDPCVHPAIEWWGLIHGEKGRHRVYTPGRPLR
jgi:hypothetical protein